MKTVLMILMCFFVQLQSQNNNPDIFEPDKLIEDIDYLVASLNEIHPTFNQYLADPVFNAKIDSIKKSLHHPMSAYDFFKMMQPLISVDGHTSLRFDGRICPEMESPLFPFKVFMHDDQVYIKENLTANEEIKSGMIIESINGTPVPEIMNQLRRYAPHESRIRTNKIADEFHSYYRLVYGNYPEFRLVINNHGKKIEFNVPGAKWEDFKTENRPQFELKILEQDIAYLYIGKFRKPDIFTAAIDSVFNILREKDIKYLIIDKRSGGGFTSLADSLLCYLTDKPYQTLKKKVKISAANEDYINENKLYGTIQEDYLNIEFPPITPVPRKNRFKGQTFVLMNYKTYSTATYFVSVIKCNHIAGLVGEEAAQPLISNGDLTKFRLPNTKLACYSSMSVYIFPCGGTGNESVKPDYEVSPSVEDRLNDRDACLDYVLELIRQGNVSSS